MVLRPPMVSTILPISARLEQLDASVVSTCGLMYYLFDLAETARLDAKSSFALSHLKKCALIAVGRLNNDGGGFCYLTESRRLQIQGSGVVNLRGFMHEDDDTHGNVLVAFSKLWADMKTATILSSAFDAASFMDLTVFLAKCVKFKRSRKAHALSSNGLAFRNLLRNAVVKFLASSIDVLVMQAQVNGDIEQRQIPSRGRRRRRSSDALVTCSGW